MCEEDRVSVVGDDSVCRLEYECGLGLVHR